MSDEIRYGIIGAGMMGIEHVLNLAHIEGATVTAVADPHGPSQDAARSAAGSDLAVFDHHEAMLQSGLCDAVVISTPNMTHARILHDVLAVEDLHVLVEKPLCTTVADCQAVIEAAENRGGIVWVGLEYRYKPPIARLVSDVRSGAVGEVKMISIREHRFPFLTKVDNWNRFSANSGGTLIEKCCHFFDLMTLLAGSKPVRVMGSGAQDVNHLDEFYDGKRSDIMDNAFVIVDFEDGKRAMLDLCMFAEGSKNEQEIAVTGHIGKIEAFVPEGVIRYGRRTDGRDVKTITVHDDRVAYEGLHEGSSFLEHLDFIAAIRSGAQPAIDLNDGLMSVAMGAAAHKSVDEGRVVTMDEVLG